MRNLVFLLLLALVPMSSGFAKEAPKPEVKASKIKDNLFFISGPGGNVALLCGKDGNLIIDDKFAETSESILAAVKSVCPGGVKFVFNTHWHFDHTGGNENMGKAGSVIVAHKNVRTRMSKSGFIAYFKKKTEPSPDVALPVITFTNDLQFHLNGQSIDVQHFGHGHTDGDGVVYFKEANVIHLGDLYFAGMYPFIDYSSGGSIEGMINTADKVLAIINDKTTIVPGHGAISTKADYQAYRDMLAGIKAKRDALLKAGKSKEAVKAANITESFDGVWNKGFIKGKDFVGLILN